MPGEIPYAVTKGALHTMTATIADALADRGIVANCINPGPTDTAWATPEVHATVGRNDRGRQRVQGLAVDVHLGRPAAELAHLQRVSAFLELDLSEALLKRGVADSSKEKMQDKQDKQSLTVVRHDSRPVSAWFDAPARKFVQRAARELLRHDFGYDYARWD